VVGGTHCELYVIYVYIDWTITMIVALIRWGEGVTRGSVLVVDRVTINEATMHTGIDLEISRLET
jgi:hypothetical protein